MNPTDEWRPSNPSIPGNMILSTMHDFLLLSNTRYIFSKGNISSCGCGYVVVSRPR